MSNAYPAVPKAFIFKRLHSLTGVFLVGYLMLHLLTNSQAALFLGDDAHGFIEGVNAIHNLPYLPLIEIFLLGVPIAIHAFFGIEYIRTAKYNSYYKDASQPYLPYARNKTYTWQRITSWIVLVGIIAHVVQMRFIESPASARRGTDTYYMVRLNADSGLPTLAERLGVTLYNQEQVKQQIEQQKQAVNSTEGAVADAKGQEAKGSAAALLAGQKKHQQKLWAEALEKRPLDQGEVIAVAPNFGTAELLMVRETFKDPLMIALYTIFVLTTCYHAFNGLWTAMISWGITLSEASMRVMLKISTVLMVLVAALGLSAIWITYWINLKQ